MLFAPSQAWNSRGPPFAAIAIFIVVFLGSILGSCIAFLGLDVGCGDGKLRNFCGGS